MDIKSMIVDIQCYIHIRTGKSEVQFMPILPQQEFAFKAAWHHATRWMASNNISIKEVN